MKYRSRMLNGFFLVSFLNVYAFRTGQPNAGKLLHVVTAVTIQAPGPHDNLLTVNENSDVLTVDDFVIVNPVDFGDGWTLVTAGRNRPAQNPRTVARESRDPVLVAAATDLIYNRATSNSRPKTTRRKGGKKRKGAEVAKARKKV